MKKISKTLRVLCLGILFLLSVASGASAEEMEAELYEKSGASGMYESLDRTLRICFPTPVLILPK